MLNNDQLKKIASMPDSFLKDKISLAVNASGGGNISLTDDDIRKIKETVLSMSADDVSKIMSGMDQSKIAQIKNALSKDREGE